MSSDPNKILVLGASSYIGRNLCARLGPGCSLITYRNNPVPRGVRFDALSMNLRDIISDPSEFSHAVILLGDPNPDTCFANPEQSRALNVTGVIAVLKQLKEWDIAPVFTSSQFVFDGRKGDYVEEDPVSPILLYGKQKVEVEEFIQNTFSSFIIARLEKVVGSTPGDKTLFPLWMEAVKKNQKVYCAQDQILSPMYVNDVAEGIIRLISGNLSGVYHFASEKPMNRVELFETLVRSMSRVAPVEYQMVRCGINDFDLKEKRPLDVSMNPSKLVRATGLKITSMEEVCDRTVQNVYA